LAKPNYGFEKRQKELAKKRKQEEKRLRKLAAHATAEAPVNEPPEQSPAATSIPPDQNTDA